MWKNLKMGCYEDDSNRSKHSKLLRLATKSEGKQNSTDTYLDRTSETQDNNIKVYVFTMDVCRQDRVRTLRASTDRLAGRSKFRPIPWFIGEYGANLKNFDNH